MSNQESNQMLIVQKIKAGDEKSLVSIYRTIYPMVENYILDNSGSRDDARDIFQDAMYILMKKIKDSDFELTSKLSTFIFGISKNLWLKKLTKKSVDINELKGEIIYRDIKDEDEFSKLSRLKLMKEALEKLGEPCQTILVQFYYFKQTMVEIAELLHYTNSDNAKNQKYKCLIRLKKMINQD